MKPNAPAIAVAHRAAARQRLFKAARALFLHRGRDAVTVDDICLAANVSTGGFYHHFRNKEDVFLLVALEELRRELERLIRAAPGTRSTGGADGLLLDLWAWAPRQPRAHRLVRNMHRKALKELSAPGGAAEARRSTGNDYEAPAMLALVLGAGRIARRALASQAHGGEREQKKAAAG